MELESQISADQRNGNLHIDVSGHFTADTAARLTALMSRNYQGKGNIFIHTAEVTWVAEDSRYAFNRYLHASGLPGEHIYLTGRKGLDIGHDATRVIVHEKHHHEHGHGHNGCGRCKNCTCHTRKDIG